jgi:hypothetical protein
VTAPAGDNSTHFYLAALHFYGFSVTIPCPQAAPDGRYMVVAHGPQKRLSASRAQLPDAIAALAWKLGGERMERYKLHVRPDGTARKQAQARKEDA